MVKYNSAHEILIRPYYLGNTTIVVYQRRLTSMVEIITTVLRNIGNVDLCSVYQSWNDIKMQFQRTRSRI